MSFDQIIYIVTTALVGLLGFFVRSHMQRIDTIEKAMDTKLSEQQARQLLADKLDPVKETLEDVKDKINKLYDTLLK